MTLNSANIFQKWATKGTNYNSLISRSLVKLVFNLLPVHQKILKWQGTDWEYIQ